MKKIVYLALVLASNQSFARDVQVTTFAAAPSQFQLIVPGRSQGASEPSSEPVSLPAAELPAQFAALAPTAPAKPVISPPIVVPAWMRGGRPVSSTFRYNQLNFRPTAGCGGQPYRPFVGLSPTGEARRRIYYADMIAAACKAGVPADLLDSLIVRESRYNPSALSPVGAIGIGQLMPGTARDLKVVNPWDPVENLHAAARYLRLQLEEFGDWHLALSAYNAGPGAVRRHRGIPPYRETIGYVRAILASVTLNTGSGGAAVLSRRVAHISFTGS